MLHLILAGFWLALGIGLFALELFDLWKAPGRFPYGFAALLLALYNLARWWSVKVARAQREQGQQLLPRKPSLRRASDDLPTPDPNFIFTDPPPRAPGDPNSGAPGGNHIPGSPSN